jgi:hypothetical protein
MFLFFENTEGENKYMLFINGQCLQGAKGIRENGLLTDYRTKWAGQGTAPHGQGRASGNLLDMWVGMKMYCPLDSQLDR